MRGGKLDRRIELQRKSVTQSDTGEETESWVAVSSNRPASISPMQGVERYGGDQWVARQQVEFRIRWSTEVADLSPLDRVIYPASVADSPTEIREANIYDIMAVNELGRREGLQILAARRADVP